MPLKKSLSQHLLKDKNLLDKLVRLARIGCEDVVVEIGAGRGDLTRSIIPHARFVHAIELDTHFRESLDSLACLFPNVSVTFGNILHLPLRSLVRNGRMKIMGNIPYHITGDILFKLLSEMEAIETAHLTMQKEVAERLVSGSGSRTYGALSVIFQLYASVRLLMKLKAALFTPPPEVESAFVEIIFKHERAPSLPDEELIDFIKACFRHKRKYLRHSLESVLGKEDVLNLYSFMNFPSSIRAEELEPDVFKRMYDYVKSSSRQ